MLGRKVSSVARAASLTGKTSLRDPIFCGAVSAIAFVLLATPASAATIFGSKLNHEPTPAETCRSNAPSKMCSWVLTIAQQNVGHEVAPKTGTIVKVRLRSCSAGSFVLQRARAFPSSRQAKVLKTGPTINYLGNASNCNGGVFIETFAVNVPVLAGDYLSVVATKVGFIYNSSGDGSLVFDPPLVDGGTLRTAASSGTGAGILMLQAEYSN